MNRAVSRALVDAARTSGGFLREAEAVALTGRSDAVRALVDTGYWHEQLPGVLVSATAEQSAELRELTALAWAGPSAALSHYNAAAKEGIWVPDTDRTWITTPWGSGARSRGDVSIFRTRSMPELVRYDGRATWTKPARSIVDLASELTRNQLEAVLLSAIRKSKTTAAAVELEALGLVRRRGLSVLREITGLWLPERESLLEDGLFADVCAVVPNGVTRQHSLLRPNGSELARFDVAIAELMLAFEADGLFFHSTDEQLATDQRRDRGAMGRGWQVVRYREGPLSDHAQVRREVEAIVTERRRTFRAA